MNKYKIKDNINLEELTKYGFKQRKNIVYIPSKKDKDVPLVVILENGIIDFAALTCLLYSEEEKHKILDLFYNMIINKEVEILEGE